MKNLRFLLTPVASIFLTSAAIAQTSMIPLMEFFEKPEDQRELSYPFVRCAGLYLGHINYGGRTYGEEITGQLQLNASSFLTAAAALRQEKAREVGNVPDELTVYAEEAWKNAQVISEIYAERMRENYAKHGEAFGNDQMINDDMEVCNVALDPIVTEILKSVSSTSPLQSDDSAPGTSNGEGENLVNMAIVFVEGFNQIWSSNNSAALDVLPKLYAPSVDFYGNNWSRQQVMAEKEEFALRWPERTYTFRADRQASYCNASGSCVVKGEIDWYAHSPARGKTSRGTAEATIGLQQVGELFAIVREDGKVLKRN